MFYVILLYALFASVFTVAKVALEYTEPFFLIGTRMTLAGVLLLGFQKWNNNLSFKLKKKTWFLILQLALFNIYLTNVLEFWGLRYLPSFKTCFIYSLSPFISALFCYLLFAEKLSYKKWIGLVIGFLGFIPILMTQTNQELQAGSIFIFSWAELAVMMAATLSVYGWILLKQLVNEHELSPLTANGFSMFIGGALALIHSFFWENWDPIPTTNGLFFFESTLFLIIVSNLICYNLYGWLLTKYSATLISFAGLTTPLFSALFGWFFLSESIHFSFYVSFSIVLAGLWLYDQDELQVTTPKKSLSEFV